MEHKKRGLIRYIALFLVVVLSTEALARDHPHKTVLIYYVNQPDALDSFRNHARDITIIAPQIYEMDEYGTVFETLNQEMIQIAKEHRVQVMPLVINARFNQPAMHTVLDDPKRSARAIRYLLFYCRKNKYYGFQFDYENISYTYRDKFTAFFKAAASEFHRHGYKLSVAVVGRSSDDPADYSAEGWQNWSGVYDYPKLGRYADFVSVMGYPQHSKAGEAGPLAGYAWVQKIIDYTLGVIPPRKISLGVPLYYTRWSPSGGMSGGYAELAEKRSNNQAQENWSETDKSPWLEYTENGVRHVAWFENARSFGYKLRLLKAHHLAGFSAWRIGQEDPAIWDELPNHIAPRKLR